VILTSKACFRTINLPGKRLTSSSTVQPLGRPRAFASAKAFARSSGVMSNFMLDILSMEWICGVDISLSPSSSVVVGSCCRCSRHGVRLQPIPHHRDSVDLVGHDRQRAGRHWIGLHRNHFRYSTWRFSTALFGNAFVIWATNTFITST
jgi:hypothetical protein